jgi:outer membrane protein
MDTGSGLVLMRGVHRHSNLMRWATAMLAVFVALTVAAGAWAQEATELPSPLTLEDALRIALEANPRVAAAEAQLRAREAAYDGQKARRLPTLSLDISGSTSKSLDRTTNVDGVSVQTSGGTTENSDIAATLSYTFYQSGRGEAIDAAREQTRASEASLVNAQRQLLQLVATVWHTIQSEQELAGVAEQSVDNAERHLELVDARIAAGTAAETDRLPVEADLAAAEYDLVSATNAVWQSIAELREYLALPPDVLPHLAGVPELDIERADLEAWIDTALSDRPDLQAQQRSVRVAALNVDQAQISAGLSFIAQGQADYGRHTGTNGETWALTAGVSFPLFDRQARAGVDEAKASLEASRQQLAELELSVAREVSQAWYSLADATERVTSAQASLASAQSNLDAARERYAAGVANVIAVTDAETTWRRAAGQLVQARCDRNTAYYRLLAATGRLSVEPDQAAATEATQQTPREDSQ